MNSNINTNNKYTKTGVYTYNSEDILFNFTTTLSISDKLSFVNSVVDTLIDDTHYNAILRDMIFDLMLVKVMTDIDTNNLNLDDIENFLSSTNIIDIIKANAEIGLIESLHTAVNDSIEYATGIHKNPLSEALANLVNTLNQKVNEVDLDSMMGMATKFASMTEDLNVDNIVKAYMESNIHKENLKEIAEAKLEKVKENIVNEAKEVKEAKLEVVKQED